MGLYAAYGSNMDPAQMLRRCPSSPHTGTGWIRGWRLTFGAEEYGFGNAVLLSATESVSDQDIRTLVDALGEVLGARSRERASVEAYGG